MILVSVSCPSMPPKHSFHYAACGVWLLGKILLGISVQVEIPSAPDIAPFLSILSTLGNIESNFTYSHLILVSF